LKKMPQKARGTLHGVKKVRNSFGKKVEKIRGEVGRKRL